MSSGIRVLCVDDDSDGRSLTATALERTGVDLELLTDGCGRNALSRLTDDEIDCIVSDYDMPGLDGLELLEAVRDRDPELPFILFTGTGSEEIASEAISAGVTDYLRKDSGTEQYAVLANRIENAVEKRRVDRARRESERELAQYERIIELAPIALFLLDEEANIIWGNDEFAAAFEEDLDELLELRFPALIERGYYDESVTAKYVDNVRSLLSSASDRERAEYRVHFRTPSGEERIHDVHTKLLPLEDGAFTGTIHSIRDITTRRRYQHELERQNERLEQFASVVSHDLRNPLNVAQGNLEIHAEGGSFENDADGDSIEQIRKSLDRMDELIDDLLSLARHGRAVGDSEPVALSKLVSEAWTVVDTADATLECSVDGTITADEGRVRALFENLFRNAVEHSSTSRSEPDGSEDTVEHGPTSRSEPDGSEDAGEEGSSAITVTVAALEAAAEDRTSKPEFYVADDGPGLRMDPDELFEFGQTTTAGGTGIGLGIVKQIADAHGWTITASTDGGARFEIRGVALLEEGHATA